MQNPLSGKYIHLKSYVDSDVYFLYELRNSNQYREFCSLLKQKISFPEFVLELSESMNFDRREQFIIEDRQGNPIGAIHLYGLSKEHQNAFITICIVEQKQNSGYGIEAFVLYLCYMIEKYNFHKVMADVYSHNSHALHLLSKAGFIEEGYFKDHRKKMNQNG